MANGQWKHGLRQSFRILPTPSQHLRVFLDSDGQGRDQVLLRLPYEAARSRTGGSTPDPKRYRDPRYVYESVGLLFEDGSDCVRLTELGKTTRRWLDLISPNNSPVFCRHVAYALAAMQLRNPTKPGREYPENVRVFPAAFIWRAMLQLDNRISSDELNRVVLKTTNADDLAAGIDKIRESREKNDLSILGPEVVSGASKNDRIIPWMAMASFGWTLISDKDADPEHYYTIPLNMIRLIREAVMIKHVHRELESVSEYVRYLSDCACLPPNLN